MNDELKKLPEGWEWKKLKDLLENIESGKRPKGGVQNIKEGIPSIGAEHLNYGGGFSLNNLKFVPKEFADKMNKGIIRQNDIVIVKDGATTGKTSYISSDFPYNYAVVNEHVFIIRVKSDVVSKWIFYILWSKNGKDQILKDFRGAAQGGISPNFINIVNIPIPQQIIQKLLVKKIEKLFSELDSGIEVLKKVQEQLKTYRQAVLHVAFTGKLTQKWRYENSESEIMNDESSLYSCYSELVSESQIPKGWKSMFLGNFLKVSSGKGLTSSKMKVNGKYPVYGGNGISGHHNKYMYNESKLIIGRVGAKCGVVHITKPKSWITDNALVCEFNLNSYNMKFLYYLFSNLNLNKLSVSTAQPVISGAKLYKVVTHIPNLLEQQIIVEEIESRLSVCDKIEETVKTALTQAEFLKQSILKQAFEGKLI
ncbi:MAG: hypothetical protein FJ216_07130 [Ignavibacteria bacterium]|nr:hypothetical protein [Ignavibacteria bacterium]